MSPIEYLFGRKRKPEQNPPSVEGETLLRSSEKPVSFRELLVAPVLVATGSYAAFALVDMAFRTMLPLYLSTPITMGGLDLDPSSIGTILAIIGIGNGVAQMLLFTWIHGCLGAKRLFLATSLSYLPAIALLPTANWVAREYGVNRLVWCLIGVQSLLCIFANFSFGKKSGSFHVCSE